MHTKLAGRLPLQEMISQHIDAARTKLAAAEDKEKEKVRKLVSFEKKEHGHVPSEKEEREEYEKKGSAFDPFDPDQVEKLASALDTVAEKLASDSVFIGGEKHQGGQVLATMSRVPGKQPWAKSHATGKHQIPNNTGMKAAVDNPGAATAVPTDDGRAPGGTGAEYPKKGVLKTSAAEKTAGQSVLERIEARKAAVAGEESEAEEPKEGKKQKQSSAAIDFILGKIASAKTAEFHGGGMTLDFPSQEGPKPSMVPGRSLVQNKDQIKNVTKREAKAPRKKELKQVLTEPALSAAHDNVVQENLRNASKGGVKIAAAKAYLKKIASEGCTCEGKGTCRHCKLAAAIEARKAS